MVAFLSRRPCGPPALRARVRPALLLVCVLAIGVASRRLHLGWEAWDKSLGDVLYAVAVYLALVLVRPGAPPRLLGLFAFALCFAIELFQITGIPIELARAHPWVHWILGAAFAWHDVACYALGVTLIAALCARSHVRAHARGAGTESLSGIARARRGN